MHVFLSIKLNIVVDKVDYIVELSKIESKRESMNGKCGLYSNIALLCLYYESPHLLLSSSFLLYIPNTCAGINVTCFVFLMLFAFI